MAEVLSAKNISKRFGTELVLDNVNFTLETGETVGIVGENGAGKSVFVKILSQILIHDKGEVHYSTSLIQNMDIKGVCVPAITTILQETMLINSLSVAENIFFGRWPKRLKRLGIIDWKKIKDESKRILGELCFDINVDEIVKRLNVGQKQIVEIARALLVQSKVIILDEPFTGLSRYETREIFEVIKGLKSRGVAVILITHRLEDVIELCDSVCIMKSGKLTAKMTTESLQKQSLIDIMADKKCVYRYPKLTEIAGRIVLQANLIKSRKSRKEISFYLRKGEILGITGLLGSGRSSIARMLFGIDSIQTGKIIINGTQVHIKSPAAALKEKVAYLSEDRELSAIEEYFNIPENITVSNIAGISRRGLLNINKEKNTARRFIKSFVIKTPKVDQKMAYLSSGNQQKVFLARWMYADSNIFILDEPTKNIDSTTKIEIYNFMNKYILSGNSIILISSDINELMGMSDRILIMYNGYIKKELKRKEFSENKIMYHAAGGKNESDSVIV